MTETDQILPGRYRNDQPDCASVEFDDDADRRAHWAAVYANKDFINGFASKFRPLLMTQEVKLLQATPWGQHLIGYPSSAHGGEDLVIAITSVRQEPYRPAQGSEFVRIVKARALPRSDAEQRGHAFSYSCKANQESFGHDPPEILQDQNADSRTQGSNAGAPCQHDFENNRQIPQ